MRKLILVIAILFSCLSFPVYAQVGISVNISTQPVWGPVGYDRADYYYIPDIETYYSVSRHEYTYYNDGRWISSPNLPPRYSNYDLYHSYKVVINEPSPWMHHDKYRGEYSRYGGRHDQPIIRDSHDERYYANPGHPQYNNWKQHHNEGHHDEGHHDEEHKEDRH